jgi:hypothetical protein
MLVTRVSQLTKKENTLEVPITPQELERFENRGRELAQNVLPNLDRTLREFLMTGITPTEWTEQFGTEED